ncbi:DUF5988 family protein [Actinomadura macra]|uniref:DUF5988 family protein n=1 Tax=Actinomadura macra TaxID=46164 RepID=UPI0008314510|nr:DUF5988 family protein [Actinomadura macra]
MSLPTADCERDHRSIDVRLEGGPADIPRHLRLPYDEIEDGRIKIDRRGGREHFECIDGPLGPDAAQAVFRWTQRTRTAE